jgi:hypothetical protein
MTLGGRDGTPSSYGHSVVAATMALCSWTLGSIAYGRRVEPLRPSRLPADVRRNSARLHGTVQRWTTDMLLRDRPVQDAVEALRQITTDPIALGVALGRARAFVELDGHAAYRRAVVILRAAGADEDTARRMLAWLKIRRQSEYER